MNKRVLFVSYSFPPIGGPRSIRWLHLVKTLTQRGWQIDILTINPSSHDSFFDQSLLGELPPEVKIYRTFPGIFYSLLHLKKKPIQGFPKTTIEWLPFGLIKGISLIKSTNYTLIISSALPFVGHLVAYCLKKKTNIPWIADYGDSISFNPMTSRIKRFLGKAIEKKMLKSISGLIVPFKEMGEEFIEFYPFLRDKPLKSIGNGLPEKYESIKPYHFKHKFTISYIGNFYKNVHDPHQFFQAVSSLKNPKLIKTLQIIVAGNTEKRYLNLVRNLKIDRRVKFLGYINYNQAISIMKGSSVVLYIGGKRKDYHFPFKIIECAASGRPIIGIRQSSSDLGADFIEKNRLGIVVANKEHKIKNALQDLFLLWNSNNLDKFFKHLSLKQYLWSTKGYELEKFLEFITSLPPQNN